MQRLSNSFLICGQPSCCVRLLRIERCLLQEWPPSFSLGSVSAAPFLAFAEAWREKK